MDKKKKIRLVVLWPTVVTVIVIGGILTFVLLAGAGKAHSETLQGSAAGAPPMAVSGAPGVAPGASAGNSGAGAGGGDVPADQAPLPPDMTPQACDFSQWVGKPVDEAALVATGRPYRILKPGDAATMDFSPARIDVETGDDGVVTKVHCG